MKEKNWMRTVFTAYSTIDKVLKAIDKQVLSESLSSTSTFGAEDTLKLADSVLDKIHRKRKLCVLKYLTEQSVKSIKEENAKVLIFKFFDELSDEEICDILKISSRTLHRKIASGLNECYAFFVKNNCNASTLEKCFGDEGFLRGIYSRVTRKTKERKKEEKPFCLNQDLDFHNFVVGWTSLVFANVKRQKCY